MGGCSSNANDPNSKNLDIYLKKSTWSQEVKLLLLGPGESGKSTIFKQLKIIQDGGGYSQEELIAYTPIVRSNCVSQMRVIIEAAVNLKIEFFSQDVITSAQKILGLPAVGNVWNAEIGNAIKSLWQDKGIKETYGLGNKKYQLNETAGYFFDNIDRFMNDSYIPTYDDVLRVRVRSTGIEEATFIFEKIMFRVVDVGGQRSERRKWIHCFDCVTSVIFCASLSGYDQVLREDRTQNRMQEAILLFDEVANSNCFHKNDIILFLNKEDLFLEKIAAGVDLNVCFSNYTGGNNPDVAKEFIKQRFVERSASRVFVHYTTAIDTKNIEFVIRSVRETLLTNTLDRLGIMNKPI